MNKNVFKILSITILILVGVSVTFNSIQAATECKPGLIPCGRNCNYSKTDWDETDDCTLCHFFLTAQTNIMYLGIALAGMSLLVFVIAGVMFIIGSHNPDGLTKAKSTLKTAIIGFILVLVAWIIVTSVGTAMGWKEEQRGTYGEEGGRRFWRIECNPG